MATLPDAADYGARVALRSSRIDIPGQGEMAVADALANAAQTFTNMAIEHKQKDDALSYSNAKNEYLTADIQERAKLADDENFATHDQRYREAMKGHYERLFPTVRSDRDRSIAWARAHGAPQPVETKRRRFRRTGSSERAPRTGSRRAADARPGRALRARQE